MDAIKRIAFLWVGQDIAIPRCLTRSARLTMKTSVQLVQLTDKTTPRVEDVDLVERHDLSENIMTARLQAYSLLSSSDEFTFLCDADSLFLNDVTLEARGKDILLAGRVADFKMNDQYPEYYPEFTGKMVSQVMPFLFGAMAVRGSGHQVFPKLLEICKQLPERFHRWYGDQFSLHIAEQLGLIDHGSLNTNKHLYVVRNELSETDLKALVQQDVQMITFKGPNSKNYISNTLRNIEKLR